MITFTDAAAKKIREIITQDPSLEGYYFRIGIEGGGCSGFQYMFGMESEIAEDDSTFEINGIDVVIDPISYGYLVGTEIDFHKDLMGESFSLKNPSHRTCGCGHSFQAI